MYGDIQNRDMNTQYVPDGGDIRFTDSDDEKKKEDNADDEIAYTQDDPYRYVDIDDRVQQPVNIDIEPNDSEAESPTRLEESKFDHQMSFE